MDKGALPRSICFPQWLFLLQVPMIRSFNLPTSSFFMGSYSQHSDSDIPLSQNS